MSGETELHRRQRELAYREWIARAAELYAEGLVGPFFAPYADAQRAAWLELDDEQRQLILELHGVQA